jgi:hypothetical protein
VKWRELNPSEDLAITGYLNLERGITFNTNGFNFTDMLVSSYHVKNLASLIQILGRANGDVEYVKIMNIWSPKHVISSANEYIEAVNDTHSRNPEEFNESDFRKASPRDRNSRMVDHPTTSGMVILIVPPGTCIQSLHACCTRRLRIAFPNRRSIRLFAKRLRLRNILLLHHYHAK